MTKNSTTVDRIKNQPVDIPGLPTLEQVNAAMSMAGMRLDHTRAVLVQDAWNSTAWRTPAYEGMHARRQACYECAARTLQAYDAAKAKPEVVKAVPASKPRSATRTTVIFDATKKHQAPRSFARGVLAKSPGHVAPVSIADMEWAASQAFATDAFRMDGEFDPDGDGEPDWDSQYREAMFVEKVCNGFHL